MTWAAVLGAILVVRGPTVVLPLLALVRPNDRLRSVEGEGSTELLIARCPELLCPRGEQQPPGHSASAPGEFALSIAVRLVVGGIGAAVFWLPLSRLQRSASGLGTSATPMVVIGALVSARPLFILYSDRLRVHGQGRRQTPPSVNTTIRLDLFVFEAG